MYENLHESLLQAWSSWWTARTGRDWTRRETSCSASSRPTRCAAFLSLSSPINRICQVRVLYCLRPFLLNANSLHKKYTFLYFWVWESMKSAKWTRDNWEIVIIFYRSRQTAWSHLSVVVARNDRPEVARSGRMRNEWRRHLRVAWAAVGHGEGL